MGEVLKLREDAVKWRAVDEEVVALDVRSSIYFSVNRSGAVIWPDLASGASRDALAKRLAERCGIDEAQAYGELDDFIGWLVEHNLLEG